MKINKFYLSVFMLMLFPGLFAQVNKLNLEKCITLALKNNHDLKIQRQQVNAMQARENQARTTRLPQLNAEASYLRFSEVMEADISKNFTGMPFQLPPTVLRFGDEDNYSLKLSVTQPLFTGWKISNSIAASKRSVLAEQSNEQRLINELVFRVKEAYYNLLKAQQREREVELSLQLIDAHLTDLKNMFDQGLVAENEVLKVEIKKAEIELMRITAQNSIALLKKSLLNILGLDLNMNIDLDDHLHFNPKSFDQLLAAEKAFKQRPELTALDYNIEALKHQKKAAQGDYFPSLSLIGNYEYGKPGLNKLENEWMDYWTVGIAANWRLWDWGNRKHKVAEATASLMKISESREKFRKLIRLDVQQAFLKLNEVRDRVRVFQKMKQQSAENYRLVKDRFQQGLETNTEFLDAETQLTKAKIEELGAIADYNIALANIERAMGNFKIAEQ